MSKAERRAEFIPILANAFAELGYRRATTAELARRCDVQENILYRLWPDKRSMLHLTRSRLVRRRLRPMGAGPCPRLPQALPYPVHQPFRPAHGPCCREILPFRAAP